MRVVPTLQGFKVEKQKMKDIGAGPHKAILELRPSFAIHKFYRWWTWMRS